MNGKTKRWLYLLAGSGLSANDIRELCAWLANDTDGHVARCVLELRKGPFATDLFTSRTSESSGRRTTSAAPRATDVKEEVARVLRDDARLKVRDAAAQLAVEVAEELRKTGSTENVEVPAYSKESLSAYVSKLLKLVAPQVLLHLAYRIRARRVPEGAVAWPLSPPALPGSERRADRRTKSPKRRHIGEAVPSTAVEN